MRIMSRSLNASFKGKERTKRLSRQLTRSITKRSSGAKKSNHSHRLHHHSPLNERNHAKVSVVPMDVSTEDIASRTPAAVGATKIVPQSEADTLIEEELNRAAAGIEAVPAPPPRQMDTVELSKDQIKKLLMNVRTVCNAGSDAYSAVAGAVQQALKGELSSDDLLKSLHLTLGPTKFTKLLTQAKISVPIQFRQPAPPHAPPEQDAAAVAAAEAKAIEDAR